MEGARSKRKGNQPKPVQQRPHSVVEEPQEVAGRDPELHLLLSLATEDELEHIVKTLHGSSPFSPLGKSLVIHGSERQHGWELKHAPREEVERYIETRFRFLAADASCVMVQEMRYPSYREALLYLRKRLRVPCKSSLETPDLEMEVFLHLLSQGADTNSSVARRRPGSLLRGVQALHSDDVLPTLAKTAATVALTASQAGMIQSLGNVVMHRASHLRALAFVHAGSVEVGKRMLVERAKQRLVGAVVEYTALRSLFSFVGPLLLASAACDLAVTSLGPDSTRLAKVVALLAQIRLLKTHGWVAAEMEIDSRI